MFSASCEEIQVFEQPVRIIRVGPVVTHVEHERVKCFDEARLMVPAATPVNFFVVGPGRNSKFCASPILPLCRVQIDALCARSTLGPVRELPYPF